MKTLEWWISRLMLNPLFFLISRLNIACSPHVISRLINRSGLRILHSKVFNSGYLYTIYHGYFYTIYPGYRYTLYTGYLYIIYPRYLYTINPGYLYTISS